MKYNIKSAVNKAKEKKDEMNKVSRYFKPKKGVTRFRVVPIGADASGEIYPFKTLEIYGYDAFKGRIVSPTTYGNEDPIRNRIIELMNQKTIDQEWGTALLKRFRPSTRYIVPVVVRQPDDNNGKSIVGEQDVKLLDLARGQFEYVLKAFLSEEEYGSIIYPGDIDKPAGFDIKVDKGQKPDGKWFVDLEVVRRPSTLADTDAKIEALMGVDLDAIFKEEFTVMSDDGLLAKFADTMETLLAAEVSKDGPSNVGGETTYGTPKAAPSAPAPAASKTTVSDDDLDALMSDDAPF